MDIGLALLFNDIKQFYYCVISYYYVCSHLPSF